MSPLQMIFNELSFVLPRATKYEARAGLVGIYQAAAAAVEHGFESVFLIPESFLTRDLAENGYSLESWLGDPDVELEVRQALQSLFTWGPFLDDVYLEECKDALDAHHEGAFGVGLSLAASRDHSVFSVGIGPWNDESDVVVVMMRASGSDGEVVRAAEDRDVTNIHCPDSVMRRLRWISERCCVKPAYLNPGSHDPSSGVFRGGGDMTTVLPEDSEAVYKAALPADPRDPMCSWWGANAAGHFYRYQASWIGAERRAHWNGTTDPDNPRAIRLEEIPKQVRTSLSREP